ncbi:carboxymethylenebutenolidase [Noviherbaspirillum humi]|uniref:Carboxymethylenebutenolidase n=1 Tax=Noviherbaspirillum humi TaxID=1688639 RepID=A0A239L6K7_9BURK|nr:dienelactone hydrolase family protein [Noviherbaspirillum humi]SNT26081.1 carboxymethylenebutenolidase [Noviherbaspirillum humi]
MSTLEKEIDTLIAPTSLSGEMDRRDFIKTALGTGFAAAVMPVMAQSVIKTDTAGLTAGEVKINVNGQEVPVYRAQPAGKSDLPVILVVSEIFGVHEHIADVARRFAKQGYLALAPDLFLRQGDPSKMDSIPEIQKQVISKVPDAQVMTDLDACVAWAGSNGGNTDKLGITGFCWGGRITWLYAAHNPKVKAGVAWYGRLTGDRNELQPRHPVDIAADLKAPILGLYAGKDAGISLESVDQMKAALAKGGSKSEFVIYPEASHAFHADYRPSYREPDARDGWKRCLEWFRSHGLPGAATAGA